MTMTARKRAWRRPELIVLVRGRPEEAVLVVCKRGGAVGPADEDPLKNCKFRGAECNATGQS